MHIYPHYGLRPKYLGERRTYDLLSRISCNAGFVVHSLNLPDHAYKRWGEADFVVVRPDGITVLEVKGGVVSLAGRVWRYENARGQVITSTEGPARQALSAALALEEMLTTRLGRKMRCRWGVVFPLSRFKRDVAELPRTRLADSSTCDSSEVFQAWLDALPFDQHHPDDFALSPSEVQAVQDILVPEFTAFALLGLSVSHTQGQVATLTAAQFHILQTLEANPRLCITGGAGTGKTELAVLCAKAEKAAGRKPAIVTRGGLLLAQLGQRLMPDGIPVTDGRLPAGTDTLIVDEGQDFAHRSCADKLFEQLPGGQSSGRWRWFMDPNLQFSVRPPDPAVLSRLESCSTKVQLTRNVRSTREIVCLLQVLLNADVGISQIDGFGIKVGIDAVEDEAEEVLRAVARISEAIEDGVQPSDIAVLGAAGSDGPVCRALLSRLPDAIRPFTASSVLDSRVHGLVSDMASFRGLESRMVVLVDLDHLPSGPQGLATLYIGMSRASAILKILVRPAFRRFLRTLIMSATV